jgi:ferredoxin
MKVHVDATKCAAYGTCVEHCPSLFELDEWGYAAVKGDGTVTAGDVDAVRIAAADCPEHAIVIEA